MTRQLAAAVTLAVAMVTSGCHPTGNDTHSTAPVVRGDINPRVIQSVVLGRGVGWVGYAANRLVYAKSPTADGPRSTVFSRDLTTGQTSLVARSGFAHGMFAGAVAVGSWTVVVDQTGWRSPEDPRARWRVIAIDSRSHRRVVLATSGRGVTALIPVLKASDGLAYWTSAEADRSARESVWRAGWSKPRLLLRNAQMVPASESVGNDSMSFVGPGAKPGATLASADCWQIPITGGHPGPWTTSGLAMSCSADGPNEAWTEHIEAHPKKVPAEGMSDEPYRLWLRIGGSAPRLVSQGYMSTLAPLIIGRVLVWATLDDDPVFVDVDHLAPPRALGRGALSQDPMADGSTLILVHRSAAGSTSADVVDMDPSGY
ncbi:MAG TPA: hypothetical protein VGM94_03775 [Galbitalea sp.]